jgi:type II secretory pathway pseudopilin PulG
VIQDLALLVLGWLLGLLAPAIVDGVRRRREARRVEQALKVELLQVALRIATASHYVQMRFGTVDRQYLEWLASVLARLPGAASMQAVVTSVSMQLTLTDEQIAALAARDKAGPGGALIVKKYAVPLLDARVSALWEFDSRLQHDLLEIRAHLDLFNEDVDQVRLYFDLSFQDLSAENHSRIALNLTNAYRSLASRARMVVDRILSVATVPEPTPQADEGRSG